MNFRAQSVLLNTVQWRLAEILNEVGPLDETVGHDPTRINRVTARFEACRVAARQWKAERDALRRICIRLEDEIIRLKAH